MDLDQWILESERIQTLCENPMKEVATFLPLVSIYINAQMEIVNVQKENLSLSEPVLKNGRILDIAKKARPFYLKEILHFFLPLEPEQIPLFSQSAPSASFLHSFSVMDDIPLPPTLFLFHSINTVYLCFYERKSSFKTHSTVTKRVHFRKTHKFKEALSDLPVFSVSPARSGYSPVTT